jgi:N-dimethylarginine dimethylaminohydrolase
MDDIGQIRMVLLCRPGEEWMPMMTGGSWDEKAEAWIGPDRQWYWLGRERPDLEKAQAQHDALALALRREGAEVVYLSNPLPNKTRSVFTRDVALVVPGGCVLCRMATSYRRGEELPFARTLIQLGLPILLTVHGSGMVEGGSFAMLNRHTAMLGISHRINSEGARQLRLLLSDLGIELITVDLPGTAYHLDGALVMVDHDKALINHQWLPHWFIERLNSMGIRTVDAHPTEGPFAVNCLAVRPGRVLMSDRYVHTADVLDKAGVEVVVLEYSEIPMCGGGIHCSTLPLIRDGSA